MNVIHTKGGEFISSDCLIKEDDITIKCAKNHVRATKIKYILRNINPSWCHECAKEWTPTSKKEYQSECKNLTKLQMENK